MRILLFISLFFLTTFSVASAADRTIDVKSAYTVAITADRLEQVLLDNGMTVFAHRSCSRSGISRACITAHPAADFR